MRALLFTLSLAGLAGCGAAGPVGPPVEWTTDVQAVADGNNRFAFDLYRKLGEKPGNVFFSPFSAHAALGMTTAGANGPTRDEMVKVLHLPADPAKALAAGELSRYYARGGLGYELAVANAIWGQKGLPWKPDFLAVQRDRFGAGFQEADFRANPDGERLRINAWAEDNTRGRITDLLEPGIITRLTRMVLANAIYFKGLWAEPFRPGGTREAPFTRADGSRVPVPMMSRSGGFRRYTEGRRRFEWDKSPADPAERDDGFDVAELPYEGGEVSMVVIIPHRHDGLPDLVKRVTTDALVDWLAKAQRVHDDGLFLPKFRLEADYLLKEPLESLGMRLAFQDGEADFSGLTAAVPLSVSAVIQKAFVEVNEEGTEAAAATAVVIGTDSVRRPTPPVVADRPFLFLIRDTRHGTILFLGRYESP